LHLSAEKNAGISLADAFVLVDTNGPVDLLLTKDDASKFP